MSDKFVSGGLLFAAASFFTYHIMTSPKPKPNKRRFRPRPEFKTNIATITEEISEEIIENNTNPSTPHNTLNNSPIQNSPLVNQDQTPDENIPELVITSDEKTISEKDISDEVDSIVENINNFDCKKDSNTNSISSFLELNNTGSLTGTEELEFTKINESVEFDKILTKIINKVIVGNSPPDNVYGSPGLSDKEDEVPIPVVVPIPRIMNIYEIPKREEYKDKEYNSDLEDNDVNYFSDNESNRIKYKIKKKKRKFLNFFKRTKTL